MQGSQQRTILQRQGGFGLSIVKNEIARCNGDIRITSIEDLTEFLISFEAKPLQAEVI